MDGSDFLFICIKKSEINFHVFSGDARYWKQEIGAKKLIILLADIKIFTNISASIIQGWATARVISTF